MPRGRWPAILIPVLACAPPGETAVGTGVDSRPVGSRPSEARSRAGDYISWREHRVDDEALGGVPIRGGDGSVLADLDADGHLDIVSVHEADTEYDGVAKGHVRIAFGTESPDRWELVTLAEGAEVGAAEDVAVGDLNGDGHLDVVVACELAHLIYFENPGPDRARRARWERLIPAITTNRGSFIRVFVADLTGDGRLEVVTANKGAQNPGPEATEPMPISWLELRGRPLDEASWVEHVLTRVPWPINAQPVDLDGDGDPDILGGSVAEGRIFWFENQPGRGTGFVEHPIQIASTDSVPSAVSGFNLDFADLNGDGRLDIVAALAFRDLVWLEQPADRGDPWPLHRAGTVAPDQLVGLALADIDDDGDADVIVGGYSRGPRDHDDEIGLTRPLGRIAWFENPGGGLGPWTRHDVSRRVRGMFDKLVPIDLDDDGDLDFVSTRGNSAEYDGVFWLEQVRTREPAPRFERAREVDSPEVPLSPVGLATAR
ncbi:MAG: FG-GAP repeat domain-containing protein [Gemmatimonadales bacterium]